MSIFKACDIRAPYGTELQDTHATALARAIVLEHGATEVLVAGDARPSTPSLKHHLIAGLMAGGCRVCDLGTVPTPVFNFARERLGVPVGVMVTASHNPPEHNGFKIALGKLPITPAELQELGSRMEAGAHPPSAVGEYRRHDILPDYLAFTEGRLEACRDLRVVVDYGNGVGALTGPTLWGARGAKITTLFEVVDGNFPNRSPNPAVAGNLTALSQAVRECEADLGVAFDGDADRLAVVDERGRVVPNDKVIALFARDRLHRGPEVVVYDQKCSRAVAEAVRELGGEAVLERSGYTFIKTTFLQRRAIYAGELSGHHFFRELPQGDDGVIASLFFAGMLARSGRPLSALVAELPDYPITPDIRLPMPSLEAELILTQLREGLASAARLSLLDGVRAEFPTGWGLARRSVTEPLLTLRFEGENPTALRHIVALFREAAPGLAERLPEELTS